MKKRSWWIGLSLGLLAPAAMAEEGAPKPEGAPPAATAPAATAPAEAPHEAAPAGHEGEAPAGHEAGHEEHGEHGGEHEEGIGTHGSKLKLMLDLVVGFRSPGDPDSPTDVSEDEEEEGRPREKMAYSLLLGAKYSITPHFLIGARIPLTLSSFVFPDTKSNLIALGNIEIAPQYSLELSHGVELGFELGLAAPTATGDEFGEGTASSTRRRAYANLAAARFRGYRDNALFASHRFGLVPGAEIEVEKHWFDLRAFTKGEVLIIAGGTKPPDELGTIENVAVEWVSGVEGHFHAVQELLGIGAKVWSAYTVVGEVKAPDIPGESKPDKLQLMVEPEVKVGPEKMHATLGFLLPIGGYLSKHSYKSAQLGFVSRF